MQSGSGSRMKRVIVDRFGGPEVLHIVEEEVPRPGRREVRVRVLAAGVSYTDAMIRVGSYLGVPKPPFTPGYELVGVVEEAGPDCERLRVGDRIGSLTVWGADAEQVCVLESNAVKLPEDVDPGEILSLVFTYMTAYQLLHRTAKVKAGEEVLVHGRPVGWRPRCWSSPRWLAFASWGRAQLATSPRSSDWARWRSTTRPRTSWHVCES
ncbi:MAG: alcohol dehydrogenase catalytic domain-containing protein [Solirubrobacteraceae bacterium]